jgi:hypothetical protein
MSPRRPAENSQSDPLKTPTSSDDERAEGEAQSAAKGAMMYPPAKSPATRSPYATTPEGVKFRKKGVKERAEPPWKIGGPEKQKPQNTQTTPKAAKAAAKEGKLPKTVPTEDPLQQARDEYEYKRLKQEKREKLKDKLRQNEEALDDALGPFSPIATPQSIQGSKKIKTSMKLENAPKGSPTVIGNTSARPPCVPQCSTQTKTSEGASGATSQP